MTRDRTFPRTRGLVLCGLTVITACSERGRPPFPFSSELTLGLQGEEPNRELTVDFHQDFSGQGTVLLDSVTVTITERGVATVYDDPDVSDNKPLELGSRNDGQYRFRLTLDNPIPDLDRLEGSCALAGRTITVDAIFYSDRNDQSQADDPPLFPVSISAPLISPVRPPGSKTFPLSNWWQLGIATTGVIGDVYRVVPGGTDAVLVTAAADEGWSVYRVPLGSTGQPISVGEFDELPVAGAPFVGPPVYGGHMYYDEPVISLRTEGAFLDLELASPSTAPEYPSVHLASLSPSTNGVYAVVQTSFKVPNGAGEFLVPPSDKYYGSFLLDIGPDLSVTTVEASDRDILYVAADQDGSVLQVSGDLPPRTDPTGIRVERRDPSGQVVWTYDEPTVAYRVSARSLSDGGALVAYESALPSGTVIVVEIDGSGAPLYRYTALGHSPTVASGDAGAALVSFSGVEPALTNLPTRPAPLLVELSPEGIPVRGQQLGCGGTATVVNTLGGVPVLAGAFAELADLDDELEATDVGRLSFLEVD